MYTEALIYHTATGWHDLLEKLGQSDVVNFWSGRTQGLRLEPGAPFFFKRAGSGSVVGWGSYRHKVTMTINEAWRAYGFANGVKTLEGFVKRAREVLRIRNAGPATDIGCIELEDVEFLPEYLWVPLSDLQISDRIVSQYVSASVANVIIARFGHPFEEVISKGGKIVGGLTLRTAKGRTFQAAFRKVVLSNYGERCAICDIAEPDFLVATRIVPVSLDLEAATDPCNGIALCLIHDRAFEKGYIYLSDDNKVTLSPLADKLRSSALLELLTAVSKKPIRMPRRDPPGKAYIIRHRRRSDVS